MPLTKSENPILQNSPSALNAWALASRPKTWIASLSPVLIGTALAAGEGIDYARFILVLLFSLLIQIGTNFANDFFDFAKGADTAERIGPKRAVQQGWISPRAMLRGALLAFGTALLIAIPLMLLAGWWSFPMAGAAVLFGILYTGGPKPLGYLGLGELLVLLFFGPIACCGAYYLQTLSLSFPIFLASLAPGLLSSAILIANNLRDQKTDAAANKRTLIVRFGRRFGSWEYTLSIALAASIPPLLVLFCQAKAPLLLASSILPASIPLLKKVFHFQSPAELIPVLQGTSLLLFLYTLLFSLALLW